MATIDRAIDLVSESRATVGGLVSRFEFRGQQIVTSLENIEAAKSSIMDVDLAAEQSRLVSSQVLVQASVSALSQANELPQALLRLLQ
jgi:flagellin